MRNKASRAQVIPGWYVIVTNEADGFKRKVIIGLWHFRWRNHHFFWFEKMCEILFS